MPTVQELLTVGEDQLANNPQLTSIVATRIGQPDVGVKPELGRRVLGAANVNMGWLLALVGVAVERPRIFAVELGHCYLPQPAIFVGFAGRNQWVPLSMQSVCGCQT